MTPTTIDPDKGCPYRHMFQGDCTLNREHEEPCEWETDSRDVEIEDELTALRGSAIAHLDDATGGSNYGDCARFVDDLLHAAAMVALGTRGASRKDGVR